MKKIIFALGLLAIQAYANAQQILAKISIENSSNLVRKNELVSIPWRDILKQYPKIDTANFKVISQASKQEIPFQLERLGQKDVANLLLQVSIDVHKSLVLQIEKGKASAFGPKTYARYVPERKDDFAWENDVIAFRAYGKALEGTSENAQGLDIWSKRTANLIINKWYKSGDYHNDHGEGLDFYSVGMTLGAGDIAPFANGKIVYPNHYRRFFVLDNGPLRSSFRLEFDAFDVEGKAITLSKTYSLDAGSQLNKVVVQVTDPAERKLAMVVGLVTSHAQNGNKYMGTSSGISYYWHKTNPKNGTIGVAALVAGEFDKTFEGEGQLLNQLSISNNQPIVYYNGGVWDKQGSISSEQEWIHYLQQFKAKLAEPVKVVISKK
jgi:hypothetical protein